ncbi:MAG: transcription termination/antitermination protein NusG [Cetobacterium somerae]|jgi:transcriptional antiterminator NusG|uniref:Transcription termination/antitermination protein NusG n=1 Tax=Cetobacterium somerae ATCC BAA-474 TaxID=1319815 RepID=U7V9D1_9FUSO|nr:MULTISPECIES: transcription termination/antitermination protein NusG [Cetobacterium]ERT68130.1 transcription termination/antitermination factor NusG [Cetobacterium somerae ATCC BAA-474]MBC2852768.1 transcription termination/antitermination factor NusG [Cetobacterium sp. 2G large]MCQ9628001.1 transcription termination/antitermination factor NusG [Cetobacterium somerae]WVJ00952.1 transcription termination/antitermination protein NusG [Cetobacterium somerae]
MEKSLVKKWFMIHTYSGYEKKVKTDLEQKIETLGLSNIVTKVLVPEEETIEERRGKKKVISRKLFPGYVMLEMEATREESGDGINFRVDSDAWYVVRNTNGVTGFVGVGSDPIPMEDDEVENIFSVIGYKNDEDEKAIKEVIKVDYEVGDYVKLLSEGFENQEGKVAEIDMEHRKVKVMMEMFGRMTPIEVDLNSVEKA